MPSFKLGQSKEINLLTEQALEAQEKLLELEMFGLEVDAAEARLEYFRLLDELGLAITEKVGPPYRLRVRALEIQHQKRYSA